MNGNNMRAYFILIALFTLNACSPVSDADKSEKEKQKPVALIASPNTEQFIILGDEISFVGHGSFDPKGNIPLVYKWTFSGATASEQQSSLHNPGPVRFTQTGKAQASLVVTNSLGVSSEAATIMVNVNPATVNRPPEGKISYAIGNKTGLQGDFTIVSNTEVVFQGSATDPDNDQVSIFNWDIPTGVNVTSTPDSALFNVTFPNTGLYVISLTVIDDTGNSDLAPAQIAITVVAPNINLPPNGSISHDNGKGTIGSIGNVSIASGKSIEFNGFASDPEGDPISYAWSFIGSNTPNVAGSGPVSVTYSNPGTFLVTLSVTDSLGNQDIAPAQISVTVTDIIVNLPPDSSIQHDQGTGNINIAAGDTVIFTGLGSDPEGDVITYSWDFNGLNASATTGKGPITVDYPNGGVYLATLTVSDSAGNVDLAPSQVIINVANAPINQPPNGAIAHDKGNGSINSSGNVSVYAGDSIEFIGSSVDPEGDSVNYNWDFAGMRASSLSGSGPIIVSYPSEGSFVVQLNVNDVLGNSDPTPAQITVTVLPVNLAPNGAISHDNGNGSAASSGNINIFSGDSVIFNGSAIDPEGDAVTLTWDFTGGSASSFTGAGPITVTYPFVGSYDVLLTATDSLNNSDQTPAKITITVTAANQPPDGIIRHDNGNGTKGSSGDISINTNGTVEFNGSATDPEGQTVSYAWNFGGLNASATSGSGPITVTFPTAGAFLIQLTVTDSMGKVDLAPAQMTVTVSDIAINLPPDGSISHDNGNGSTGSVGNVSIFTNGSILFVGSALDPENDTVIYNWNFAGAQASSNSGSGPITVTYANAGSFTVILNVTDSFGNADIAPAQIEVTVTDRPLNQAPNGSIIHDNGTGTINSTGDILISVNDTIVFNATATDPDNNTPLTYAWEFMGLASPNRVGNGPLSVNYPNSGTFLITLTVADSLGKLDATPAQITVTVAPVNRAPTGSISHDSGNGILGSIGDVTITAGDTIVFTGSATDPENNKISYSWDFGVSAPTNAGPGPIAVTYPGIGTFKASLTSRDSLGNVDPNPPIVTVTVKPKNSPPNGTISHNQGTGNINIFAGDSVIFTGAASDPEGNVPITYIWDFGVSLLSTTLSDPVTISYPTAGTFQVTLKAKDSLNNIDPTPASVTVTVTQNLPPVSTISHNKGIGNINIFAGETVIFTASATDPESNLPFSYSWDFGVTAPSNIAQSVTVAYPNAGTYNVFLTATDALGNADPSPASVTVTVITNQAPVGSISHDKGAGNISIFVNESVVYTGAATDLENNTPFTYNWDFGFTTPLNSGQSVTVTYPSAGTFDTLLTVTDSLGNADATPAKVSVTVINRPPDGTIQIDVDDGSGTGTTVRTSVATLEVFAGDIVAFYGSGVDPDGDNMLALWDFGGASAGSTSGFATKTVGFPNVGTYIITLTVSDIIGNTDPTPAKVTVTAIQNLPPFGSTITHNNGIANVPGSIGNISMVAGSSINFYGSATDPESMLLRYRWDFGVSTLITTNPGPINITYPNPSTVPFQVQLIAADEKGLVDPVPATLLVNVRRILPAFQYLPVLEPSSVNAQTGVINYLLTAENNVPVNVVTPDESWITPMMRYNQLQLPPVIVAKRGDTLNFSVTNSLIGEDTTVHWHGFKIPAAVDGGPEFPIGPGANMNYNFTLEQPAASLWFHPHAHKTTATQVYSGLAGAFVIKDDITDTLENTNTLGVIELPSGKYDIPLLVQDRLFNANVGGQRTLNYRPTVGGMGAGMLGNRILINGVEMPGLEVDTRQYRFRLYNASNARTYDFALSDNSTFMVIGTDGGLLNNPVEIDHIKLGAGERAEIVINFGNYTVGEGITLVSRTFNDGSMGGGMGGGGIPQNGAFLELMRFDVTKQIADNVVLYTSLPGNPDINTRLTENDTTIATPRPFKMSSRTVIGVGNVFEINDSTFTFGGPPEESVALGATEIWNITNISQMAHPFHAHAIQWQILSRGKVDMITNVAIPGSKIDASGIDLGWKDTVLVQPGESVQFIGRFDPVINVGIYMYHCHILEHEDNGMMGMFEIK